MGKKICWFTNVKRLFVSEPKPKSEKKRKNSRSLFKTLKSKHYPAVEAPETTMLSDAERGKYAVAITTAAAVAAEAAIAAANAAAEVARLTNFYHELRRKNLHSAAKKIQTCYKGYLARKALSALKGVVKLQAVVRGELARRHVIKQLAFVSLWELRLQRSTMMQKKKIPATLGTTDLAQLKLRNAIKQTSPFTHGRRSFCHDNDKSTRDDDDRIFPAYMATTESAKAKAKAKAGFSSTLKQRRRLPDSYSCQDSPSKLSIISSWNSFKSSIVEEV